jgi:tetratricopeptide (TPR) repeat protein
MRRKSTTTYGVPWIRAARPPSVFRAIGEAARTDTVNDSSYAEIVRLIRVRDWRAAEAACARFNRAHPRIAAGWHAASQVAMALHRPSEAAGRNEQALRIEPRNPKFLVQRAQCLLALGQAAAACAAAAAAQREAAADPVLLDAIGGIFSKANDQERALAAFDAAVALAPDNPHFIYNRAAARRFLGQIAAAESDYDKVIALKPTDYEAYRNRSDLRPQTAAGNHIAELDALLRGRLPDWRAEVQLRYALAKEYEDLGLYAESFDQLAQGARKRREHMRYDVNTDVATVEWIIEAFPSGPSRRDPKASAASPIFIVGLPRSGTTLVERILGSHSQVSAGGELQHFAASLVAAVRRRSGAAALPRRDLVARSAQLDFAALGEDYLARVKATLGHERRFTDKMPLNYLYCGLIGRSLPNAKIVHVTRRPMAVCYAMFKMLFEDGYPFSYDLEEIARYYLAYRRLMEHWNATMPGAIHELRYEALVADQLAVARELLEFCALDWEDACAMFHRNPSATTTASAAQVRRPLYSSSVSQWRHYERQLAPLRALLDAAGVET